MAIPLEPPVDDAVIRRSLIACLRGPREPEALDLARSLAREAGFSWDAWSQQAQAQSISPLVYSAMRGSGALPAGVEARLRVAYLDSLRRGVRLFHELEAILVLLNGAGVQAVLLKGAALALTVYGDVALRPMADVDLLVRRDEMGQAIDALVNYGYAETEADLYPGFTGTFDSQVALQKQGSAIPTVEPHWHFFDSPHYQQHMPMEPFWCTATPVRLGRATSFVLSPERQFLHLAAHLAMHHGGDAGLLWLNDLAEVLHFYGQAFDWSQLLDAAQDCELGLSLQRVMPQLVSDWGAAVPGQALERLRRLRPTPAEARAVARSSSQHQPAAQHLWADLRDLSGLRNRARFAWANMCPSPDYMRGRYRISHPALLPFYYPYRWLSGLPSLFRLVRGAFAGRSRRANSDAGGDAFDRPKST